MYRYIVRRLIQAIPTIFGITLLSFLIMSAAPGGPTALLAFSPQTTPEQRERIAARLGANDPWLLQYVHWLIGDDWRQRDIDGDGEPDMWGQREGILRGDFGTSFFRSNRDVIDLIGEYILPTIELTASALLVGLVFGIPIGIIAAINRGGTFDNVTRVLAVVFNAVPNFWLGLILILVFGSWLGWLPLAQRCKPVLIGGCPPIYERLEYLLLPTFTLGTVYIAGYSRYMRTSMLDVIGQDYIRTAHAKGLSSRMVWFRHGARNALIPIATFLGPALTTLWGGAVLTETIFSWPGIGRQSLQAVVQQDYPFVMAVVLLGGIATILGYILSDILYALIDPRIRFS
ncbi:MAG: ABC transporter permease [Chloroflexota bacterium]